MCVCVCVCACVCVCVCVLICVCACVCMCVYVCICVCACVCVHMCMCVLVHVWHTAAVARRTFQGLVFADPLAQVPLWHREPPSHTWQLCVSMCGILLSLMNKTPKDTWDKIKAIIGAEAKAPYGRVPVCQLLILGSSAC